MENTALFILCAALLGLYSLLAITFLINSISDIIETRKRAKREAERNVREAEYHLKRMQEYK